MVFSFFITLKGLWALTLQNDDIVHYFMLQNLHIWFSISTVGGQTNTNVGCHVERSVGWLIAKIAYCFICNWEQFTLVCIRVWVRMYWLLQLVMRNGEDWQQLQQRHSDCYLQGCQAWQHPCVTLPHLWVHHWSCPQGFQYPQQQLPFWMGQVIKGHFSHPMIHMAWSTRHMPIMPTMQRWQHLHFLLIMLRQITRVGCLHVDIDSFSPPYS